MADKFPFVWFTCQILAATGARPSKSYESQMPSVSPMWVADT